MRDNLHLCVYESGKVLRSLFAFVFKTVLCSIFLLLVPFCFETAALYVPHTVLELTV